MCGFTIIMVSYDLSHLVQEPSQEVLGPIQDDEALFLYALVRTCRLRTVLEVGGLGGYSAANFLKAVGPDGIVFTVDLDPVPQLAPNHVVLRKDARHLTAADVPRHVDLLFFDCHDHDAQMDMYRALTEVGAVTDRTTLVLHDTNTHPFQTVPWAYPIGEGEWVHQPAERRMANAFKDAGYDVLCVHTHPSAHGPHLPFRHGLTVCKKHARLHV